MSNYLAGMVARAEHQQMNNSQQPVLDFDRRGYEATPNRMTWRIGKLFQWAGSSLTTLGERLSHEQPQPATSETPVSNY
jgi:hypothetical protein